MPRAFLLSLSSGQNAVCPARERAPDVIRDGPTDLVGGVADVFLVLGVASAKTSALCDALVEPGLLEPNKTCPCQQASAECVCVPWLEGVETLLVEERAVAGANRPDGEPGLLRREDKILPVIDVPILHCLHGGQFKGNTPGLS